MFAVEYYIDGELICEVIQTSVPQEGDMVDFCNESSAHATKVEYVKWFIEDRQSKVLSVMVQCTTDL